MENVQLLSQRLKWAVDQKLLADPSLKKITNAAIAKIAGVSPPAVGYWFADANGMEAEPARRLGAFLGVDAVWLEKGEGNPKREEPMPVAANDSDITVDEILELLNAYRLASPTDRAMVMNSAKTAAERALRRLTTLDKSQGSAS